MLLTEAIDALLVATKAEGRSHETVVAYQQKLKPLVESFGNVSVEEITTDDLRRYIVDSMDRPVRYAHHAWHKPQVGRLSMFTVASRVRALKRLFNFLESEGFIKENPVRRIKTPRPRNTVPKAIEMQSFVALLETTESERLEDIRDRAIILVLADTGCRVGGLCALRVADVDMSTNLIVLTEKGSKTRQVPFNPPTREALKAWMQVRPQDRGAWLFISLGGTKSAQGKLLPGGVVQMLKRRAEKAGVRGPVNPHAFRHFFAREFLLSGGDLATLADLMGHTSVEVTKSSYGIFSIRELQEKHRRHSPVARMSGGANGTMDS